MARRTSSPTSSRLFSWCSLSIRTLTSGWKVTRRRLSVSGVAFSASDELSICLRLRLPPALGAAVRRLLDDPAQACAVAERGRAVARTWPGEADTVAQVAAVYGELLG